MSKVWWFILQSWWAMALAETSTRACVTTGAQQVPNVVTIG
jgi:hypothetical protein